MVTQHDHKTDPTHGDGQELCLQMGTRFFFKSSSPQRQDQPGQNIYQGDEGQSSFLMVARFVHVSTDRFPSAVTVGCSSLTSAE
jgi:hypothetical protein